MAYTTTAAVAEELGISLTGDQEAQAEDLIAVAGALIERRTSRDWDAASPATELLTVPANGLLYLAHTPVTAITSVTVRSAAIGAGSTALVAGTSYEVLDAARGIVRVAADGPADIVVNTTGGYADYLATVTYTHTGGIPAPLSRAATLMVAAWMQPALAAASTGEAGISQISFGQDLTVKFADGGTAAIPDTAAQLLRLYTPTVVFA